jgi:hypothetical protein
MNYGSSLARTGIGALVIGGIAITPLWQIAAVLGLVLAGGLAIRAAHVLRRR